MFVYRVNESGISIEMRYKYWICSQQDVCFVLKVIMTLMKNCMWPVYRYRLPCLYIVLINFKTDIFSFLFWDILLTHFCTFMLFHLFNIRNLPQHSSFHFLKIISIMPLHNTLDFVCPSVWDGVYVCRANVFSNHYWFRN